MPQPSTASAFSRAIDRLDVLFPLALVPFATSLAAFDDLVALAEGSSGVSITFGFPTTRVDVWTFLDASAATDETFSVAYPGDGVTALPLVVLLVITYAVVSGLLTAGYFGSIREGIETGRFDFAANLRRYGARFVGFELLVLGLVLGFGVTLLASPPLFVLGVLVALLLGYLFYPTLYLVVLRDLSLEAAFRRAYRLTTGPEPTFGFFVAFALAVAACSVPLSLLARSSLPGGLVATVAAAPLGLVCNAAAMVHVRSIVDDRTEADEADGDQSNAPVER